MTAHDTGTDWSVREPPTKQAALAFLESADFHWHQRFELVPGVYTPGVNDIEWLLTRVDLPADLTGLSVLDIGTTNGATAFSLERRGAEVIAVDVMPPELFGFERIRSFLGSSVQFVEASVYELPEILDRTFDVIIFWGVLYHLRHPLLALDRLRELSRGRLFVESAVADHELGHLRLHSVARFYRFDELGADPSNWFAPTVVAMQEWVASAGFDVTGAEAWPEAAPERALVSAHVATGIPEYQRIGYERPLRVEVRQRQLAAPGEPMSRLPDEPPPVAPPFTRLDTAKREVPMPQSAGGRVAGRAATYDYADEAFPIPAEELRWRVTGNRGPESLFRETGRASLNDLETALRLTGRTIDSFDSVLDFGCGCGRVIRHMAGVGAQTSLHGCDIDADAVAWAAESLPFARFSKNEGLPPLPYDDDAFDLVVNHSVFTHLPEDYQDSWLEELRRVVRPGGFLLLTVAGPHAFSELVKAWLEHPADPSPMQQTMQEKGFLYIADDSWQGTCFPEFYHSAFHTPNYVVDHWGRYLTVLAYLPLGALRYQDMVLLRRD